MRRKLICGIGCFIFTVMAGLPADAPACHQGYSSHTAHHTPNPYESTFHKMDANHDGIVTQHEFVAAHQKKLGTARPLLITSNWRHGAAPRGETAQRG